MRRRSLAVAVACLLTIPLAGTQSSAQESAGGVLLILDASGSMNRVDDDGVRLIDGAKEALKRLLGSLPEGTPVGLRVYGHRVSSDDRANGCGDTELIVPVGPLDRTAMTDAIDGFSAKGFTPIGLSLQEAATDLPDGRGVVILVSDGEDTCAPPDPCEVAAALVDDGIQIRLHAVGFLLADDDPAREQLTCIADAGGGTYREVTDIEPLAAELGRIILLEGITEGLDEPFHLPVTGGATLAEATLLQAGDLSGITFHARIKPGEERWFAYDLDGVYAVTVGAGVENLQPGGGTISVRILDEAGNDVHLPMDSRFGVAEVGLDEEDWLPPLGATVNLMGFDVPWSSNAGSWQLLEYLGYDEESYDATLVELLTRPAPEEQGAGRYYVGFSWDAPPGDTEYELGFGLGGWPHQDVKHLRYREVSGAPTASDATVVPRASRDAWLAPPEEVTGRGGYIGDIGRGETRWYRVQMQPDEAVAVRAFLNRPEGTVAGPDETFSVDFVGDDGGFVTVPHLGRDLSVALDDPAALDESFLPRGIEPRPLVGAATAWLAEGTGPPGGFGTVLLGFTWQGEQNGAMAQIEFVVDTYGGLRSLPQASEPDPPPTSPPATTAPTASVATTAAPIDQEAAAPADDGGGTPLFIIAGAAVVVLSIAGGVVAVRRRRRSA